MNIADALGYWGHVVEQAEVLLAVARDRRSSLDSMRAAHKLGELGHGSRLLELARNEHAGLNERGFATYTLGRLGLESDLLALGRDKRISPLVRVNAAKALVNHLGNFEEATNILFAIAQDEDVDLDNRAFAVRILGRHFGRFTETFSTLVALARDRRAHQSDEVEQVFEALLEARRADDLGALARDKLIHAAVRIGAAERLIRLGHISEAVEILLGLAIRPEVEADVRKMALRGFSKEQKDWLLSNLGRHAREHPVEQERQKLLRAVDELRRLVGSGGEGDS
jgi:hypothetical protein